MALPLFPLIVTALAGAGIGEIIENVFVRRVEPAQAVAQINLTRVLIVSVGLVLSFFLVRMIFREHLFTRK